MGDTVGIILASRGLIFSDVLRAIENERTPMTQWFYHICSDKVIPDNLNFLVDEALQYKYKYLLFIEEDTVPPPGAIKKMIHIANNELDPVCVAVDYPLYNGASSIWRSKKNNEILFCGFGCTLVDTRIFEKLEKPYFHTDMELMIGEGPNGDETRWQKTNNKDAYGKHDIHFFWTVREKGFKILQLPDVEAKHLKIVDYGKELTNKGLHNIGLKADKVTQRYTL